MLTWLFHTPRRLFLTVAALAVVVALAASALAAHRATTTSPTRPHAGPRVTAAAPASELPDPNAPLATAVAFARAWAGSKPGESSQQWAVRLARLATPELIRGLRITDPAARVIATVGTPRARYLSDASALVVVPLSTGQRIAVTVVAGPGGWKAADVQPDIGDAGSAP